MIKLSQNKAVSGKDLSQVVETLYVSFQLSRNTGTILALQLIFDLRKISRTPFFDLRKKNQAF